MSVLEHLAELRRRLIVVSLSLLGFIVLTYWKISWIIKILLVPLQRYKLQLVYFSLVEGFMTRIKIALVLSLIIISPVIIYQFIAFIQPALSKKERRFFLTALFYLTASFMIGASFGFTIVLPASLNFFVTFGKSYLTPVFSGSAYFSFLMMLCLICGFIFLIPFALVFLGRLGLISSNSLKKWRKTVLIVLIATGGILAPATDWLTFMLLGLPVFILYELSIWVIFFLERARRKNVDVI